MNDLKYRVEIFAKLVFNQEPTTSCQLQYGIMNDRNSNQCKTLGFSEYSEPDISSYNYKTTIVTDYFFEKHQDLIIYIRSQDHSITETVKCSMGSLMGSRNNTQILKLSKIDAIIELNAKKLEENNVKTNISFGIQAPVSFNKEMFYIISNFNDDKDWRKVYKSEERNPSDNYDLIEIESSIICRGNLSRKVMIEFFDSSNSSLIGKSVFSFSEISVTKSVVISNLGEIPVYVEILKNLNFVDYLTQGLQINVVVGVDFTMSNKNITDHTSNHYIYGCEPNDYERAIRSCGSIIAQYDYDQQFPLLGFGGIPDGFINVEHSFPLNYSFNGSPCVNSIDEMVDVYKNSLTKTRLYGPTFFAPLIKNTCRIAKDAGQEKYFILMILTDGMINDMDETSEAIVEASHLPISIIIIGIGKEDFSNMDILDGDEIPLKSEISGKIVERDIVQFVEFNKYEKDSSKLAEEVLKEVPRQVEDYYRGKKIDFGSNVSKNIVNHNINLHQNQNMNMNVPNNNYVSNNFNNGVGMNYNGTMKLQNTNTQNYNNNNYHQ